MAKPLGTCSNCHREGMKIGSSRGHRLCGSCQAAIAGTEPGSQERELRLQEAAEKFAGKPKMSEGRKMKPKAERNNPLPTTQPPPNLPLPPPEGDSQQDPIMTDADLPTGVTVPEKRSDTVLKKAEVGNVSPLLRGAFIDFDSPDDAALIERICDIAKKERRTMSAQVLYFLDKEVKFLEQEYR